MSNKRFLIWGIASAVVVWTIALVAVLPESGEEKSDATVATANPPAAIPDAGEPVPSGPPTTGTPVVPAVPEVPQAPEAGSPVHAPVSPGSKSVRPPKAPRKTLAIFRDAGEICVDAATGEMLSGKNIRRQCPPASVTKIMTLYLTLEAIEAGKISLNDVVLASKRAYGMGGTQLNLDIAEPCKIEELIYGLMLQSANDAAVVLAETVSGNVEDFVVAMNRKAEELGLQNTRFATPHGLPPSRKERNAGKQPDMTTAEDLAKLSVALLKRFPDSLRYSATITRNYPANQKRKLPMPMKNHNRLLEIFEACDGLKTGWTNDGASIVTTASRGNRRVIAVVLGGLVINKKGEIDPKTSQRERNQRAAELMYQGLRSLDVLQCEPTPFKGDSKN